MRKKVVRVVQEEEKMGGGAEEEENRDERRRKRPLSVESLKFLLVSSHVASLIGPRFELLTTETWPGRVELHSDSHTHTHTSMYTR